MPIGELKEICQQIVDKFYQPYIQRYIGKRVRLQQHLERYENEMYGTQPQGVPPKEQEEQPSGMTPVNVDEDIERSLSRRSRHTPTPVSTPELPV